MDNLSPERTFVFIKPDGVRRNLIGEIVRRFEEKGLKIIAMEFVEADQEILTQHYPLHDRHYLLTLGHVDITDKSEEELEAMYQRSYRIVENLQQYVASGPIVKMIIEGGENTVATVRQIVGKTNPAAAEVGTIRGDLGEDSYDAADVEGRSVYNLVHASGTPEEAIKEMELWFKDHPAIQKKA